MTALPEGEASSSLELELLIFRGLLYWVTIMYKKILIQLIFHFATEIYLESTYETTDD